MRRDTEHKKNVQAALHRLMDGGMSLREISDLAEIDYQVLMNFSSKKMSIGAAPLRKLSEWLASRVDSLGANTAPPSAVKKAPPAFNGRELSNDDSYIAIAVAQLHSTLQVLQSPFPKNEKLRAIGNLLATIIEARKVFPGAEFLDQSRKEVGHD